MDAKEFDKNAKRHKKFPTALVGYKTSVKTVVVSTEFGIESIWGEAFKGSKAEEITIGDEIVIYYHDDRWPQTETFCGCKNLKKVRLPYLKREPHEYERKYKIGERWFKNCRSLEEIEIPPYASVIGESAFENCKSLRSIALPITITEIHARAFQGCDLLETLRVPSDCSVAPDALPKTCTLERYAVTPKERTAVMTQWNVAKYGEKGFDIAIEEKDGERVIVKFGNQLPADFTVPDGVTEIAKEAFASAEVLEKVYIPDSVKKIGERAFMRCRNLREVRLPSHLTEIPKEAFWWCTSLETINYPSTLEVIGDSAFLWCEKLGNPTLPDGLKKLGKAAFQYTNVDYISVSAGCECDKHVACKRNPDPNEIAIYAKIIVGGVDIIAKEEEEAERERALHAEWARRHREEIRARELAIENAEYERKLEEKRQQEEAKRQKEEEKREKARQAQREKEEKKNAPQREYEELMASGRRHMASELHVYYAAVSEFKKASQVKGITSEQKKRALAEYKKAVEADEKYHSDYNARRNAAMAEEMRREAAERVSAENRARFQAEQERKWAEQKAKFAANRAAAERAKHSEQKPAPTQNVATGAQKTVPAANARVAEPVPNLSAEEWYQQAIACAKAGDRRGAYQCYLHAAEKGHAVSMNSLGLTLIDRKPGVPYDEEAGFQWFQKAVEAGHKGALRNVAMCYEKGIGVQRDLQKALRLYEQADQGKESWDTWNVKDMMKKEENLGKVRTDFPDLPIYPEKYFERRPDIGISNLINMLNAREKKMTFTLVSVDYSNDVMYYTATIRVGGPGSGLQTYDLINLGSIRSLVDDMYHITHDKDYKEDIETAVNTGYGTAKGGLLEDALITVNATRKDYNVIGIIDGKARRISKIYLK